MKMDWRRNNGIFSVKIIIINNDDVNFFKKLMYYQLKEKDSSSCNYAVFNSRILVLTQISI